MLTFEEKINLLPAEAKQEIFDFVDFMLERYCDKQYWLETGSKSLDAIWNNSEDDIYNELLKG